MTRQGIFLTSALASVLAASACGIDSNLLFGNPPGSSGSGAGAAAGGSGGSSAQGGQGGTAMSCDEADECPGEITDCQAPECDDGVCGTTLQAEGTPCDDDDGEVCDGQGNCVKTTGSSCNEGEECLSSFCADGYCCDTVCTDLCEACNLAGQEGSCSPLTGSDPANECASNEVCDAANVCVSGEHVWSLAATGVSSSIVNAMALDGQNNILIIGDFEGNTNLGGDTLNSVAYQSSFVAKFDADGNHLWSFSFGDAADTYGNAIAIDQSNNVYIAGGMAGTVNFGGDPLATYQGGYDLYVVKYSPSGAHIWSKHYGGQYGQWVNGLATTTTGEVVAGGYFSGTLDFGGSTPLASQGGGDAFLVKFDSAGTPIFSKQFGDGEAQVITDVAVNRSNDDIITTGTNAGIIIFGSDNLETEGNSDIFIAHFDKQGTHQWSQQYGNDETQKSAALSVDDQGNIAVCGSFVGEVNFGGGSLANPSATTEAAYVAHFDADGKHLFSRHFGNTEPQTCHDVAHDPTGHVVIGGYGEGDLNFGGSNLSTTASEHTFVAKYGPYGTHLWSRLDGTTGQQHVETVATDSTGATLLSGFFTSSIDFGSTPLSYASGYGPFIAKLKP